MPDEKIDQKRPVQAAFEPRPTQQRLVDDTVDDSFPASDPPAWTTSGTKSVAAECEPSVPEEALKPLDQGLEGGAGGAIGQAARRVQEVYRRGASTLQEAGDRLPQVTRYAEAHPMATLLVAGAVGYGLAWLIHGRPAFGGLGRAYRTRPITDARRRDLEAWEHTQDDADMTVARYAVERSEFSQRPSEGPGW